MTGWRLAVFGVALFAAAGALGMQAGPGDWRGFATQLLAKIDLAGEADTIGGRDLRLSRATLAPGGHAPWHSHQGDPTIVYVVSGVLTNHHLDGDVRDYHPGEVFTEFGAQQHWIENAGNEPVVYLAANLHRQR